MIYITESEKESKKERDYIMYKVFIHGLGQNASSWSETISYMEYQKSSVYPELSSFIEKEDVSYSKLYKGFAEYCDSISEPLNLCGLSLGAVLALNYTLDNPEKVKSLVLIAPQYKMPKLLLKFQNTLFRFMPESAFRSIGMTRNDFIALTNSMMDLNLDKDLKTITCPVLLLCGEKDRANKKATKELAKRIEKAEIQFIKNSKHEMNLDSSKELAKTLDSFYSKVYR